MKLLSSQTSLSNNIQLTLPPIFPQKVEKNFIKHNNLNSYPSIIFDYPIILRKRSELESDDKKFEEDDFELMMKEISNKKFFKESSTNFKLSNFQLEIKNIIDDNINTCSSKTKLGSFFNDFENNYI